MNNNMNVGLAITILLVMVVAAEVGDDYNSIYSHYSLPPQFDILHSISLSSSIILDKLHIPNPLTHKKLFTCLEQLILVCHIVRVKEGKS